MYETNSLLYRVMIQNEVEVFDQYLILKVLNPKKKDAARHLEKNVEKTVNPWTHYCINLVKKLL